jgi:hypothetical protein
LARRRALKAGLDAERVRLELRDRVEAEVEVGAGAPLVRAAEHARLAVAEEALGQAGDAEGADVIAAGIPADGAAEPLEGAVRGGGLADLVDIFEAMHVSRERRVRRAEHLDL